MNRIITEAELRSRLLLPDVTAFVLEAGVTLTPAARDYLDQRGIVVRQEPAGQSMTRVPIPNRGAHTFVNAETGEGLSEKPENMTHLRGNLLVSKSHPRIRFRGGLDSLVAAVLECQVLACREGCPELCGELGEVLEHIRQVLAAEVKEVPLTQSPLFGYDHRELRRISHHVREEIGIDHPIPDYRMGAVAVALNSLRTQVRQVELLAVDRVDLLEELNRLSSGVYILFCRCVAGHRKEGRGI